MVTRGRTSAQASAGQRGRRPLRVAREWAAAGACPSSGPAGPPSPKGEGKGCSGGIHPSRGVGGGGRPRRGGGTPPYGWGYGNAVGFTWAPVPGPPHGRGRACPARGGVRGHPSMVRSVGRGLDPSAGVGGSGSLRGASGTPPPTSCPGMGGSESLPLIRPCGATFPQGGRQGLLLASGTPPPAGCPGMGGSGSLPLIRPCGATFPQGGRQGLLLAAAGACPLPRQLVLGAELEGQAVVPAV